MCIYNVKIDDTIMEEVRPSITDGMDESVWVQLQVEALFSQLAAESKCHQPKKLTLSQRLRGIGKAPKGFDYKNELEERV